MDITRGAIGAPRRTSFGALSLDRWNMNNRIIGVLVFAIIVALGTSALVYRLLGGRLVTSAQKNAPVLVAARDLNVGSVLSMTDLKQVNWTSTLPVGAATTKEDLLERAVINPILADELITEARLAPKGGGAGLAATIPSGMRAIAVKVNEVVGLAGYVLPGMRVDVVALGDAPGRDARETLGSQSKTILQNIEVLSAGENIQRDNEGKPAKVTVVNLLVKPEEAEILSLAQTMAKIQLVLRNPLDKEEVKTKGSAEAFLFGKQPPPDKAPSAGGRQAAPVRRAAAKKAQQETIVVPIKMEIISGSKRADVKVGEVTVEKTAEGKGQ